jgi:hypothetical protein
LRLATDALGAIVMTRASRGDLFSRIFVDAGVDDPALWNIRHDITPMFGGMAAGLARSRLLHCDPDHIAALCGRSAAGRFTFGEVSVIVLNAL